MKRDLTLVDENYDITRYIGIIKRDDEVLESYRVEGGFLVLTNTHLLNIVGDSIRWKVELNKVEKFSLGVDDSFKILLFERGREIVLIFKEKKRILNFYRNILKGIV